LYEALDAFLIVDTWYSGHPLDRARFYKAIQPIVAKPDFSAEQMREYASRRLDLDSKQETHPFHRGLDFYVDAADAIHDYLQATGQLERG
jgi:hypothetical protein